MALPRTYQIEIENFTGVAMAVPLQMSWLRLCMYYSCIDHTLQLCIGVTHRVITTWDPLHGVKCDKSYAMDVWIHTYIHSYTHTYIHT